MKITKPVLPVAAAAVLAALALGPGCATITTSTEGRLDGVVVKGADGAPVEHVWLGTSGEYLFWSIPIATGRFRWNEKTRKLETGTAWFKDCVSLADVQDALQKYAEGRNCDIVDVSIFDADTSYAGLSYEGLLGMFFGSSSMGVSAVLVPRKEVVDR